MKFIKSALASLFLCLTLVSFSSAQSNSKVVEKLQQAYADGMEVVLELKKDKNSYVGLITSLNDTELVLEANSGSFTFEISRIKSVRIIDPNDPQTRWFKNNTRNRLFLSPTALNNGGGTGYYQNIYIVFSNIVVSPADYVSFNLGFFNYPELITDFFFIGGKVNTPSLDGFQLGLSLNRFVFDGDGLSLMNVVSTYNYKSFDFTGGLGYAFVDGESSSPSVFFGFQGRVSERLAIISENYIIPEVDDVLISVGPRFLGKRIAADLGFLFVPEGGVGGIPYVSFSTSF